MLHPPAERKRSTVCQSDAGQHLQWHACRRRLRSVSGMFLLRWELPQEETATSMSSLPHILILSWAPAAHSSPTSTPSDPRALSGTHGVLCYRRWGRGLFRGGRMCSDLRGEPDGLFIGPSRCLLTERCFHKRWGYRLFWNMYSALVKEKLILI